MDCQSGINFVTLYGLLRSLPNVPPLTERPDPTAPTEQPVTLAELLDREAATPIAVTPTEPVREIGGRKDGPEPTRYGDWEKNGRCIDF